MGRSAQSRDSQKTSLPWSMSASFPSIWVPNCSMSCVRCIGCWCVGITRMSDKSSSRALAETLLPALTARRGRTMLVVISKKQFVIGGVGACLLLLYSASPCSVLNLSCSSVSALGFFFPRVLADCTAMLYIDPVKSSCRRSRRPTLGYRSERDREKRNGMVLAISSAPRKFDGHDQ